MAKLNFKDLIFKFIQKDEDHDCEKVHPKMSHKEWMNTEPVSMHKEDYKVKFATKPGEKIAVASYKDKEDAEKFKKDVLTKGGKAILTQEDAPANATGTAVAGTGDDSSTVVVRKKKKKELQSKLMRRLKIKEAIDKAIPDLEYPKDEVRERTNQLKGFAKEYKEDNRDDDVTGKKVFKPAKHMPKDSAGKLDVTEPTVKGSPLNKVAKVHNTNKARHSIMGTPSTQYKGLAFRHSVPAYTKA